MKTKNKALYSSLYKNQLNYDLTYISKNINNYSYLL